jgi:hypothetical protein
MLHNHPLYCQNDPLFRELSSPSRIQAYLDDTPYSPESTNRSPRQVIQDRVAHCLDGALFAAAALRLLGYPPLILDLLPEPGTDDDHVLAIYRQDGGYGAVAKSNYVGLRGRQPVYRTLRELVMTYFEVSFNLFNERTLRSYTRPLNLVTLDRFDWMASAAGADAVECRLKELKPVPLLSPGMARNLSPVDPLSVEAGTLGIKMAYVYQPTKKVEE